MQLYPPFRKKIIPIKDLEAFNGFLNNNIEFHNTNHKAPLIGKLSKNTFCAQSKMTPKNHYRPSIQGVIHTNQDGRSTLTIFISSPKNFTKLIIAIIIALTLTAIINLDPFVLIAIPAITFSFWLFGSILHQTGLMKAKEEMERISKQAYSDEG
jgi:hypothetical protein